LGLFNYEFVSIPSYSVLKMESCSYFQFSFQWSCNRS